MAHRRYTPRSPRFLLLLAGVCAALGIFIIWACSPPSEPELLTYTGSFTEHRYSTWRTRGSTNRMDFIVIDDQVFHFGSVVREAFDARFLTEVTPGTTVTAVYEIVRGGTKTEGQLALRALEANGVTYMSLEDVAVAQEANRRVGAILGIAFMLMGAGIAVAWIITERKIHKLV